MTPGVIIREKDKSGSQIVIRKGGKSSITINSGGGNGGGGNNIVTDGLFLHLDAAYDLVNTPGKNFVGAKIYSSYGGSLRSSNYSVQYSDDNVNWTTAFSGVASNNTSCGIQTNTGTGDGSYGNHLYWRYVEGSAIAGHHPRVARIILVESNNNEYDFIVYATDNCSDIGQYIIGTVSRGVGPTSLHDLTGNGNDTQLMNEASFDVANGGSIVLDGSNDYLLTTSSIELRRNFSLEIWAKFDTLSGRNNALFGQGIAAANQSINIWQGTDISVDFRMYFNDFAVTTSAISTDQWYHYVFTYNHSEPYTKQIYRNGVLLDQSTSGQSQYAGTGQLYIGVLNGGVQWPLDGNISIVRAYSKILSEAEILQNYNANKTRFSL